MQCFFFEIWNIITLDRFIHLAWEANKERKETLAKAAITYPLPTELRQKIYSRGVKQKKNFLSPRPIFAVQAIQNQGKKITYN
jgi:hypothetical protein